MESYGLEMDDLFDNHDISQELNEFENPDTTNMNETQQDGDGNNLTQNGDEEGDISRQVAEKLAKLGTGAAKKRVLRPQPKLDPARLSGDRGIPIIVRTFEKVKYKGKGHELNDLNKMMGVMEHWAHRLYPKMPFDELIDRVERLGQKKQVQTVVNKIRLDMPLLDDEFVAPRDSDEEQENRGVNGENQVTDTDNLQVQDEQFDDHRMDDDEDALNELLEQEQREGNSQTQNLLSASTPYPKTKPQEDASNGLTEEQLERIRQNQEKAKRRRLNQSADNSVMETSNNSSADDHIAPSTYTANQSSVEVTPKYRPSSNDNKQPTSHDGKMNTPSADEGVDNDNIDTDAISYSQQITEPITRPKSDDSDTGGITENNITIKTTDDADDVYDPMDVKDASSS